MTQREKDTMKIFKQYKKSMVKSMGSNITSSNILNDKGNKLFGNRYLGTFSQDNLPFALIKRKKSTTLAIINTDVLGKKGEHWVALYITPKTIYIWDSYGRPSKKLLPVFAKQLKYHKIRSIDTDPDSDQANTSTICGQLCLAWLLTVKKAGIKNALLI